MAKKTTSNTDQRSNQQQSLKDRIVTWIRSRNPILKFALGFGILMAIFYSFWFTNIFIENILNPVAHANAWLSGNILKPFGYNILIDGPKLISPEFSISINKGCDALEPMAIYLFAVLLFPTAFKYKISGLVIGIPLLFVLNQIRIISLFLIGVHGKGLLGDSALFFFDIMHVQVWQVIFIIITLIFLAYWILWSLRQENKQTSSEHHVAS